MYLSKTRNHSKRESRASRRVISPSSPRNFTSRAGLRWKMEEVEVGSSIRFDWRRTRTELRSSRMKRVKLRGKSILSGIGVG